MSNWQCNKCGEIIESGVHSCEDLVGLLGLRKETNVDETEKMVKVRSFKMPFQNNAFNKNQRVWVVYETGSMAALCYGKWRGKGRYVRYWVSWEAMNRSTPNFQTFHVDDSFAKRIVS